MTTVNIEGFDPLTQNDPDEGHKKLLEDATKRDVLNILRSYAGTFDVFNESIQNALDATEKKYRSLKGSGIDYIPKIWIQIDTRDSIVRVVDNGVGMSVSEFLYCVKPNVSFKNRGDYRGHKGVGATFLAYGFSSFKMFSKCEGVQGVGALLSNGRAWAEDHNDAIGRPRFTKQEFRIPELSGAETGTSVQVVIGNDGNQRPNFNWIGLTNASQWYTILRLKTPLGGVYLQHREFMPSYELKVVSPDGSVTIHSSSCSKDAEYYFPHDFSVVRKIKDLKELSEIGKRNTKGDPHFFSKISPEYKELDCIYEMWDAEEILSDDSHFMTGKDTLHEKQVELVRAHNVHLYGCFLSSAKIWNTFQKDLGLRQNIKLLSGGLQLASDFMVQGDVSTIPLTSAAGYSRNSFVLVHFKDANPDVGRKVFQPELKDLAEHLAKKVVSVFRKYSSYLKPDSGSSPTAPSLELYNWKREQEEYREKNPLSLLYNGKSLCFLSQPQEEEDVIALFHQLIGMDVVRGLKFFSTKRNGKYDALIKYEYNGSQNDYLYSESNPLGVSENTFFENNESPPCILEYKYLLDSLVYDFEKAIKLPQDIHLVVAWDIGDLPDGYYLTSYLIGDEGSSRAFFGATHRCYINQSLCFDVIILKDLIDYIVDSPKVVARHRAMYEV